MPRVHLKASEVLIGQPLHWDLFDSTGALLYAKGHVVESEHDKSLLLKRRAMREMDERPADLTVVEGGAARPGQKEEPTRQEVRLLLEETRIQPGDALQLQGKTESDRYVVRLIGYLKGRSIIVTNPLKDGAPVYLREGETFVVRSFSGKLACAFGASVMANPMKPYPYLHLSFPAEVRGVSVRRTERVTLRAIVAFDSDKGLQGAGIIVDMSTGGAMMLSRVQQVPVNSHLQVKFKLSIADIEYVMDIRTRVRSARPSDDAELGMAYGLQFLDLSAEDNLVLSSFVFQQLAENRLS